MLDVTLIMLVLVVVAALAFDYINGFHDTANAIATCVSTRALSIRNAIMMAAVLNFAGAMISTKVASTIGKGIVNAGDIVFATTRPYLENIAIVPIGFNNAIASTGFCVIRANAKIANPDFIYFTVISKPFIKKVLPFQRGANYPAVSDKDIFDIKISLPSLQIQKQIVAKLSAVQDYKKQLLEQKAKLKELFDSVLSKSMKGE